VSYIQFADDNEDMRNMVRDFLEASGHKVGLAEDGPSALESALKSPPDLLILDLQMPGMSGFEVCSTVKQDGRTAAVPVLMLTAQTTVEDKLEGFAAGADDYLPKPFDLRELRARVDALLRLARRGGDLNPTTRLPGGLAIEDELNRRVKAGKPFEACYLDIDNFKPFADHFGFNVADSLIRGAGDCLRRAVEAEGTRKDFVAHIGGDDFLILTEPDRGENVAEACARGFSALVKEKIGDEAAEQGWFLGEDREGRERQMPLATFSTAVLEVHPDSWVSAAVLGEQAAALKKRAKRRGPGTILVERV
jgi:PleD family two-component response regulator